MRTTKSTPSSVRSWRVLWLLPKFLSPISTLGVHLRQGGEYAAIDHPEGEFTEFGGGGTRGLWIDGTSLPRGLPGLCAGFAAELGDDGKQHFLWHMRLRL